MRNDYEYDRIQARIERVAGQVDELLAVDCATTYAISGGRFGIEVSFPDGSYESVDIGDSEEVISFAEELSLELDRIETYTDREQPFLVYGFAKEWVRRD